MSTSTPIITPAASPPFSLSLRGDELGSTVSAGVLEGVTRELEGTPDVKIVVGILSDVEADVIVVAEIVEGLLIAPMSSSVRKGFLGSKYDRMLTLRYAQVDDSSETNSRGL